MRAVSVLGRLKDPRPPELVSAGSFCGLAQVCHASVDEAAVGNERGVSTCYCAIPPQGCQLSTEGRLFATECSQPSRGKLAVAGFCSSTSRRGHSPAGSGEPHVKSGERAVKVFGLNHHGLCVCGLNRLANTPDTRDFLVPLKCPGYRGPFAWYQSTQPECRF